MNKYGILIDDIDLDILDSGYQYLNHKNYLYLKNKKTGQRRAIHRLIMDRVTGKELIRKEHVDHINGNKSDNRRINLRICTNQQNHFNSKGKNSKYTKYKGLDYNKKNKKRPWRAKLELNGKPISLGTYTTQEEAAKAYDNGAKKYFGEYARLNFPEDI